MEQLKILKPEDPVISTSSMTIDSVDTCDEESSDHDSSPMSIGTVQKHDLTFIDGLVQFKTVKITGVVEDVSVLPKTATASKKKGCKITVDGKQFEFDGKISLEPGDEVVLHMAAVKDKDPFVIRVENVSKAVSKNSRVQTLHHHFDGTFNWSAKLTTMVVLCALGFHFLVPNPTYQSSFLLYLVNFIGVFFSYILFPILSVIVWNDAPTDEIQKWLKRLDEPTDEIKDLFK